ncbi:hypothetical protein JCM10450v2_006803 [Rhodotorula kratochvilovae]
MLAGCGYGEDDLDYGEDELLSSFVPATLVDNLNGEEDHSRSSAPPDSPNEPSNVHEGAAQGDSMDVDDPTQEVPAEEGEQDDGLEEGELPLSLDEVRLYEHADTRSVPGADESYEDAEDRRRGRTGSSSESGTSVSRRSPPDDPYPTQRKFRPGPYDRRGPDRRDDRWATQPPPAARRSSWTFSTPGHPAFSPPPGDTAHGLRRTSAPVLNSAFDSHGRAPSASTSGWAHQRIGTAGSYPFAREQAVAPSQQRPYADHAGPQGWVRQPQPNAHVPPPSRQYSASAPAASYFPPPRTSSLPLQQPRRSFPPQQLPLPVDGRAGAPRASFPPPTTGQHRVPLAPHHPPAGHSPPFHPSFSSPSYERQSPYPPPQQHHPPPHPHPPHQHAQLPLPGVPVMLDPLSLTALQMGYRLMAYSAAAAAQAQAQAQAQQMQIQAQRVQAQRAEDTRAIPMRQPLTPARSGASDGGGIADAGAGAAAAGGEGEGEQEGAGQAWR